MRWYRFLPFLFTGIGVFLLAGALRGPSQRAAKRLPTLLPPEMVDLDRASPEATAAAPVHEALGLLQGPAHEWLQTTVWIRSHVRELPFESEGSYLQAPGQRYRLELRTKRLGPRGGDTTYLYLSDGRNCWQSTKHHGRENAAAGPPAELPESATISHGPESLLRHLLANVTWVRRRVVGEEVQVLGLWKQEVRQQLAPKDQPWPANLPRLCRLTLRGAERWPRRLEWFGPTRAGGRDGLLVELEFRNPVRNHPLSEEQCLRAFLIEQPAGQ